MCKDTSAAAALNGFPFIAPKTAQYVTSLNSKKLAKVLENVLDWDKQNVKRPSPKWICYHEMETKTLKDFEKIKKETRKNLKDYINKLNCN